MWRGIYALTDSILMPTDEVLLQKIEAALRGGVHVVQYRDKSTDNEKRWRQASSLLDLCKCFSVPLIINDDVALAKKINACGVHLGQQDMTLHEARAELGGKKIIGITCHGDLSLAQYVQKNGAHYVAFGACFASPTKPNAPTFDHAVLREAKRTLTVPVVAIGGINSNNAQQIIASGADMIALSSGLFASTNTEERTRTLAQLFKDSL